MRFGVLDHLFDVGLGQTARSFDADGLFLVRRLVLGRHIDDTVGIDVEGHFDLWHAARCWRNADKVELAEDLVVGGHFAFALEHADRHGVLVVVSGREGLRLLRRDRRIAVDEAREHTTQRFDAERERRYVEQQHVLDVALKHASLNSRTHGNDFIRVHRLVRFLAEELLHDFLNLRHADLTADENDFVDLGSGDARVLQSLLARFDGALDQVFDERFELGARELHRQMLRTRGIRRDEGQVHFGLLGRRKFDLRLFRGFLEALQGKLVGLQVDAVLFLELVGKVADETHVEVFTTEERIAVRRLHFEDAVADFENGNIEGAATKVINGDDFAILLVETIGKGGSRRLVDDAEHFEARDLARVLRRLTLGVVKVGGDGDDGLGDFFAEIVFSGFFHLLQDESGDLRRRIFFAMSFDPGIAIVRLDDRIGHHALVLLRRRIGIGAADKALDGEERVGGVCHGLTFRRLADQAFAIIGEGDD